MDRSEKWSDERVDRRNEGDRPEKWVDRSKKRKKKTHRVSSACERGASSADRTEKWVGRSLELLRPMCGSFSWSSVCGSELRELCVRRVRVREVRPVCVREQMENVWSENENWIRFPPVKPYFTVKLKPCFVKMLWHLLVEYFCTVATMPFFLYIYFILVICLCLFFSF